MSDWISVEDSLPEPGGLCLVASSWGVLPAYRHPPEWAGGCFQEALGNADEGDFDHDGRFIGSFKVTHWQPLPAPPLQK